ncbi:MAG: hypothetical protein WC045_01395 [Patescibacteria group bacterium]
MQKFSKIYHTIISVPNLFLSWEEFRHDKRHKEDVIAFEKDIEQNLFALYSELKSETYQHGPYQGFYIQDPKQRHIHKAQVRDRVVHHALFRVLNSIFEPTFIATSFSCRIGFGTHRGVAVLENMLRSVSRNNTRPCFALKCDVRKFFDSVDHDILFDIISKRITDLRALQLIQNIIQSYSLQVGTFERERERERVRRAPEKQVYLLETSHLSCSPIST